MISSDEKEDSMTYQMLSIQGMTVCWYIAWHLLVHTW